MGRRLDPVRGESGQGFPLGRHGLDSIQCLPLGNWAEDFLLSGFSALLLVCVHFVPGLWFISFIALIPLLWGVIWADRPVRALRLGCLFGFSFLFVSLLDSMYPAPLATLARVFCGTALFAWAVAWGRRRWGYNPLVVTLLWIACELGMIRLCFTNGLFGEGGAPQSHFGGMAVLFGFLSISFLVVLINTVLLVAVKTLVGPATSGSSCAAADEQMWIVLFSAKLPSLTFCLSHRGRAPPGPVVQS